MAKDIYKIANHICKLRILSFRCVCVNTSAPDIFSHVSNQENDIKWAFFYKKLHDSTFQKTIISICNFICLHFAVKCEELIAQKDILIKELRKELKLADERFDTDQKKQKEDLRILAERVDNQIKVMRDAYKDELKITEVKNLLQICDLISGLVNL